MHTTPLTSAIDLARQNGVRFPNENIEYRQARDELLAEEIELRRHIERVAAQRRSLPPGGTVPKDYAFVGENGPVSFSALFGDKQTLAVYSCMYGPTRAQPCPMCSSLMAAWDGESLDVEQRIARTCRGSMCSPAATAAFATSGALRWAAVRPIPAKTRGVRPT